MLGPFFLPRDLVGREPPACASSGHPALESWGDAADTYTELLDTILEDVDEADKGSKSVTREALSTVSSPVP